MPDCFESRGPPLKAPPGLGIRHATAAERRGIANRLTTLAIGSNWMLREEIEHTLSALKRIE